MTQPVVSPPTHSHVSSTISPQASIQEEPEPEVVGAGLPLLQRLKILKSKDESERQSRDSQSRVSEEINFKLLIFFNEIISS